MRTFRLSLFPVVLLVAALSQAAPSFSGPKIREPRDGATVNGRRVVFSGDSEGDYVKVSGYMGVNPTFQQQVPVHNGHWSLSRPMSAGNYQIKAEDKTGSTVIDIRVTGRGGEVPSGSFLTLASPRDGSTVRTSNVTFSGRGDSGNVSLTVYEGSRRVYSGQPRVRNGNWSQTVKLNDGSHSARVEQGRRNSSINFKVETRGGSGEMQNVDISSPRNGASVSGPRVTVSGTASTPSVGVYIYKGSRRVLDSSTKVSRGRWSFTTTLDDGSYRVEITAGASKATSNFNVKG